MKRTVTQISIASVMLGFISFIAVLFYKETKDTDTWVFHSTHGKS